MHISSHSGHSTAEPRSRRKRSARARARGAALLEGVIVMPSIIALLAGVMVLGDLHARRLETAAAAREAAFVLAASNCGKTGATGRRAADFTRYPSIVSSADAIEDGERNLKYPPAPPGVSADALFTAASRAHGEGGDLTKRGFDVATGRASSTFDARLPWARSTVETRAELTLLCNEPPYEGKQREVATRLLREVLGP
jgi:hypothetical protein